MRCETCGNWHDESVPCSEASVDFDRLGDDTFEDLLEVVQAKRFEEFGEELEQKYGKLPD